MDKSPEAFRTISEVADDLDLPQHVLRFWETRFAQIKPMKRGGGRRYYRPVDIDLLRGIRELLYEQGYTIKGVQKLLRQNGAKFVIAVGAGEVATVEALAASHAGEASANGTPSEADEDRLVGRAKAPAKGRLFALGNTQPGRAKPARADAERNGAVSGDDRALLQEALYDLLECKRLLDQVR